MRSVRAACDICGWEGESSAAARRHHEQTGHTTWAETHTLTFYGDPLIQWMGEQGMAVQSSDPAAASSRKQKQEG